MARTKQTEETQKVAKRFAEVVKSKTFISEKGFAWTEDDEGLPVQRIIDDMSSMMGWTEFMKHPPGGYLSLAREFVASMLTPNLKKMTIRGKEIAFDGATINALYKIEFEEDNYEKFLEQKEDAEFLDKVVNSICVAGTKWKGNVLQRTNLTGEGKVWMRFIKSRIMPSSHEFTINVERAIILYCIFEGKRFDVGKIISRELNTCAESTKGNFWFTSLVTQLCVKAGFEINAEEEELAKVERGITEKVAEKLYEDPKQKGTVSATRASTRKRKLEPALSSSITPGIPIDVDDDEDEEEDKSQQEMKRIKLEKLDKIPLAQMVQGGGPRRMAAKVRNAAETAGAFGKIIDEMAEEIKMLRQKNAEKESVLEKVLVKHEELLKKQEEMWEKQMKVWKYIKKVNDIQGSNFAMRFTGFAPLPEFPEGVLPDDGGSDTE